MVKTALVTGACGGIGLPTVAALIKDGWRVIAAGTTDETVARERLSPLGDGVMFVRCNIADKDDREKALFAAKETGELRLLCNIAGVAPQNRADMLDMTEESYDRVMDINLRGTVFLSQCCAKAMLENAPDADGMRGIIINIASLSSYAASVERAEYCISKAGVSMLTQLLAARLAGDGVNVYEIRPGIIKTAMTEKVSGKYDEKIKNGLLPIARWGEGKDIARAVSSLASGMLPYSTGEIINIDGGFHICRM